MSFKLRSNSAVPIATVVVRVWARLNIVDDCRWLPRLAAKKWRALLAVANPVAKPVPHTNVPTQIALPTKTPSKI
eukprot:4995053-Amphidinium_carterae.1